MISNQLLQKTIDRVKSMSGAELAVLEPDGSLAVRTFTDTDIQPEEVAEFVSKGLNNGFAGDFSLFIVKCDAKDEYVLAVRGTDREAELIGEMTRYQLETLLSAYKERFDRDNFFKSLMMENLLPIDIFDRAKKLHIDIEAYRSVLIIEAREKKHAEIIECIRNVFRDSNEDFVTAINKKNIIAIKRLDGPDSYEQLENSAKKIQSAILRDSGEQVTISYGSIVSELRDVSKSYDKARVAMDVSRIFYEGRTINPYNSLGIGRLIYQLPEPMCKLFINEIFGDISIDEMDQETITTINKFFENSLNVSETSRQLYIHRNTLVYRLDKLQKTTGLDLRVFEDAITFKIALMVSKYIKYKDKLDQI